MMQEQGSHNDMLYRSVRRCGVVTLACLVMLIPLSFVLALYNPFGIHHAPEQQMFTRFIEAMPLFSDFLSRAMAYVTSEESYFSRRYVRAMLYVIILVIATSAALRVLWCLRHHTLCIDDKTISLLFRFSIAFGIVSIFAYPMFTQDFWLSIAWGRMMASGENPYYTYFTPECLEGLPIIYFEEKMTYGPLWALVSSVVCTCCQRWVLMEFFAFKLLLFTVWVAGLWAVKHILKSRSYVDRAIGITLYGWTPMSFHMAVGEGHNDVVMVAILLMWLYVVSKGKYVISPLVLMCSVLIKYVSAPILVLELWRGWFVNKDRRLLYFGAWLGAIFFAFLMLIPVYQDLHFFDALLQTASIDLLTPARALAVGVGKLGIVLDEGLIKLGFGLLGMGFICILMRASRQPDGFSAFVTVALVIMLTILFAVAGHVWPWYYFWPLALSSIVWRSRLSACAISLALLSPFIQVYWILASNWKYTAYVNDPFYFLFIIVAMLIWKYIKQVPSLPVTSQCQIYDGDSHNE